MTALLPAAGSLGAVSKHAGSSWRGQRGAAAVQGRQITTLEVAWFLDAVCKLQWLIHAASQLRTPGPEIL